MAHWEFTICKGKLTISQKTGLVFWATFSESTLWATCQAAGSRAALNFLPFLLKVSNLRTGSYLASQVDVPGKCFLKGRKEVRRGGREEHKKVKILSGKCSNENLKISNRIKPVVVAICSLQSLFYTCVPRTVPPGLRTRVSSVNQSQGRQCRPQLRMP